MSYNPHRFNIMSYADGFTLWKYSTPDTLKTIKEDRYFNDAKQYVHLGDMILITANTEEEIQSTILVISKITNDAVFVQPLS